MTLQERIDAIPVWYHKIELPGGAITNGYAPWSVEAYRIPDDLTGKRVLDVGAWDGFWTFEALKRGASEAVAIDDFSDDMPSNPGRVKAWETFDLCKEAFGFGDECQRQELSVYDITPDLLGTFDAVFFFGTIYHCRYPLLALDKLASMCRPGGTLHIESAIADNHSAYRAGGFGFGDDVVAEFYPGSQYGSNPTNWFVPTLQCLASWVLSAGFVDVQAWKMVEVPQDLWQCRGYLSATRKGVE